MLNFIDNFNTTYTYSGAGVSFFSSPVASIHVLTSLSSVAFNLVLTMPCVLKFVDAYNAKESDLMFMWSLATVAMVAISALAAIALSSLLLGVMLPSLSSMLTPMFFLGCALKAGLLLGAAILVSQHEAKHTVQGPEEADDIFPLHPNEFAI